MAKSDYIAEATTEINNAKPIKQWINGEMKELTDTEYDLKIDQLATQKDLDASEGYKEKRALEYPSIADQLDYIYHNGLTKWKSDIIKPVKDKYPKP